MIWYANRWNGASCSFPIWYFALDWRFIKVKIILFIEYMYTHCFVQFILKTNGLKSYPCQFPFSLPVQNIYIFNCHVKLFPIVYLKFVSWNGKLKLWNFAWFIYIWGLWCLMPLSTIYLSYIGFFFFFQNIFNGEEIQSLTVLKPKWP
jgi:hypothetical protein